MAKVCKTDGKGSFAGKRGNGEVAPKNGHLHTRSRTGGVDPKQAFGSAEHYPRGDPTAAELKSQERDKALARTLFAIERFECGNATIGANGQFVVGRCFRV
jgi:hypothetical protein